MKEEITVATELNIKGRHGIFFNRGVSGSQSYAEQFHNQRPDRIADTVEQARAYRWLSRGLFEGLLAFSPGPNQGRSCGAPATSSSIREHCGL